MHNNDAWIQLEVDVGCRQELFPRLLSFATMDSRTVTVTFELPRTQHALSKPEEWNTSWERLCSSGLLSPPLYLDIALKMEPRETGAMAFEYSRLLQNTLGLRFDIGREGVDALLYENLESKWLAATPAIRRQHALVGLSEAGAIARKPQRGQEIHWGIYLLLIISVKKAASLSTCSKLSFPTISPSFLKHLAISQIPPGIHSAKRAKSLGQSTKNYGLQRRICSGQNLFVRFAVSYPVYR